MKNTLDGTNSREISDLNANVVENSQLKEQKEKDF